MKRRTVMILASAMLAGRLLATDAQARGGGGGHMSGSFGDHVSGGFEGHIDTGFGRHIGARRHFDRLYGDDNFYDDDGVYDDSGLHCSNLAYARLHPDCS
jgi:hypothetical protein